MAAVLEACNFCDQITATIAPPRFADSIVTITGRSAFERIVATFQYLKVGRTNVRIELDPDEEVPQYLQAVSMPQIQFVHSAATLTNCARFGQQIIFDSADVACAFSQLEVADKTNPWRIRECWLQEKLRDKFTDRFPNVVQSPDAEIADAVARYGGQLLVSAAATVPLVVGVPAAQWPPHLADRAVLVHFFRTANELLKLFVPTDSCSIWTENVSLAYELVARLKGVPNVWLNSVGYLTGSATFEFSKRLYGGVMALVAAAADGGFVGGETTTTGPNADAFKE